MFRKKPREDLWQVAEIRKKDTGQLIGSRLLLVGAGKDRRQKPYRLYVTLTYDRAPWPSQEEFDRFDAFDDKLVELCDRVSAQHVATMTINQKRDWIVYAANGNVAAETIYRELAEFSPQIEVAYDPGWSQYRDLVAMK